jgi:putative transcriptional regulator
MSTTATGGLISVVLESWGRRIAARRRELLMTQERLGELCDVGQATISKIECGRLDPSYELKWRVAGALNKSLEELFAYPAVVPPFPAEAAS